MIAPTARSDPWRTGPRQRWRPRTDLDVPAKPRTCRRPHEPPVPHDAVRDAPAGISRTAASGSVPGRPLSGRCSPATSERSLLGSRPRRRGRPHGPRAEDRRATPPRTAPPDPAPSDPTCPTLQYRSMPWNRQARLLQHPRGSIARDGQGVLCLLRPLRRGDVSRESEAATGGRQAALRSAPVLQPFARRSVFVADGIRVSGPMTMWSLQASGDRQRRPKPPLSWMRAKRGPASVSPPVRAMDPRRQSAPRTEIAASGSGLKVRWAK